jgi:RecB family exonuclease
VPVPALANPEHEQQPRVTRLSASAIDRYRRCARRFWYQDVLRLRVEQEPSPVLAQGNAIHHALERFFGLPLESRSAANLHVALRAVWHLHRRKAFASREEEAYYGRDALELLSGFAASYDLRVQPLAREQRVRFRFTGGLQLVGKIDRVDEASDEESIEVVDFKTGRQLLESRDLPAEPATQVYVLAAEALFKRPVSKVRLIYLRGHEVSWIPEREDVDELRERLLSVCAEITGANKFPALPGAHCDWCPYQLRCEDRQRVRLAELVVPEGLPF